MMSDLTYASAELDLSVSVEVVYGTCFVVSLLTYATSVILSVVEEALNPFRTELYIAIAAIRHRHPSSVLSSISSRFSTIMFSMKEAMNCPRSILCTDTIILSATVGSNSIISLISTLVFISHVR